MLKYYNDKIRCYNADNLDVANNFKSNIIDLLITSPPYPLISGKDYFCSPNDEYVNWICNIIQTYLPKLKKTGSIVLDFGSVYNKGTPSFNLYHYEILIKLNREFNLKLAMPLYWFNPSRIPKYVYSTSQRIRPKDHVNSIYWLSTDPERCKADTSKVLTKYTKSTLYYFKRHPETKFNKNDGALPTNLLCIPNTNSKDSYYKRCLELNLKPQQSIMPYKLVEFFIKMLTDEGDVILDIFSGSNTTGYVANTLNRKCISIEKDPINAAKSAFRFIDPQHASTVYNLLLNTSRPINLDDYGPTGLYPK